jgi:hypothetical protein
VRLLPLLVCQVVCALPATAQTVTAVGGAISGVVTDSTRAAAPGVTVTVAGPALIAPRTATTDAAGSYGFSAVPPGEYSITFALAGFGTVVRAGVQVAIGFAAPVDVELRPGAVSDNVVVTGTPAIDSVSTGVTTHFDSKTLASLPGARDVFALLGLTPGVAMAKMDVGGSSALTMQEYTAYGLRAVTGMHRSEVEGIRVGGANGANDTYFSDFASFSEIAVRAVAHSATMPVPGTMTQYVSKSGGNTYRGSFYAGLQREGWQSTNIDDGQLSRGVVGGPGLGARDVNRLHHFRDITADVGGYVRKDVAWWYAAYRDSEVAQRFAWLLDSPVTLQATVATGKVTYKLSPGQTLVGYLQRQTFGQRNYFLSGITPPVQTSDALPHLELPVRVWKAEYNAAVTDAVYLEGRIGAYVSGAVQGFKSTAPRVVDTGVNTVRGGSFATKRLIDRPQINGAVSFMKNGWGQHTFRVGGEYMADRVDSPHLGYGNACNCVSTLNNGTPTQVQIFLGTNQSENDLITMAGFADDTWRIGRRVTLSLGLRLDRYQPVLPEQLGPAGERFAAIAPVLTFNNWGPRAGLSLALTGDGGTFLKLQYGKFWLYPGANFPAAFNPNTFGWSRTHLWTNDANQNGSWDPGEEGRLIGAAGGSATRLDEGIANSHVHQGTIYVERQLPAGVAVRTGVVVNARRDPYGAINISRPLSAYSVPVPTRDPGPDGRAGTDDDGAMVTLFELTPEALAMPPTNLTTNLPESDSDYYSWELTATRRPSRRWSFSASVSHTWHREPALGAGNDFTPNALVNATQSRLHFTTWQSKVNASVDLPFEVRVIPVLRAQSGTPFARTFVRSLNYGTALVKAETVATSRTSDVLLIDLRLEKGVRVARTRLTGFADLYNLLNTNAAQTLTTSSGASFLRPTAITGPRILRAGLQVEW